MEVQRISEILPTAVQSSELATQEQKLSVNGDTNKLALAVKSKTIKECSFEEVKEVLRKVMMKVGLRAANLPNDLEKLVLYEHILTNYGGNRLNEISLAFDFAIKGELADGDGVAIDANCYENFSCLYLSRIMNAYRHWSRQEIKFVSSTTKEEQKIFTQAELDDYAREDSEWQYQMFLKGLPLTYPESNDKILKQDGLLKEGELVMEFFLRRATAGAEHIYSRVNNSY